MVLTTEQIRLIEGNNVVVLCTANKYGQPRAALVETNLVQERKIVITDNQMVITRQNIMENPLVSILAYNKDYSKFVKITGKATYHSDQGHLDWAKSLETNKNWEPKGVVEILINNVEESK